MIELGSNQFIVEKIDTGKSELILRIIEGPQ